MYRAVQCILIYKSKTSRNKISSNKKINHDTSMGWNIMHFLKDILKTLFNEKCLHYIRWEKSRIEKIYIKDPNSI